MSTPTFQVAVLMEQVPIDSPWQSCRWQVADVLPDEGTWPGPAVWVDVADARQVIYPGFSLGIFRDEAEGYYLNVSSPEPAIFVMWRQDENGEGAIPHSVTLSYNEAARWMDAQEQVERVSMPQALLETLSAWVQENYRPPEKKQRIRPKSFESKDGRYQNRH